MRFELVPTFIAEKISLKFDALGESGTGNARANKENNRAGSRLENPTSGPHIGEGEPNGSHRVPCRWRPRRLYKPPTSRYEVQVRMPRLEQGLRALDADRLELVGVEAKKHRDGRGYLRGLHWCRDSPAARRSGPGQQDGNVPVLEVITAVLGDLGLVADVDDPVLRDTNQVRHPWIAVKDGLNLVFVVFLG